MPADPDRPEKLKPGYDLVLSVRLNHEGRFTLDWNLMEHETGWDRGHVDMLKDTDNVAAVIAELGNLIASALKDHIHSG